MKTGVLEETEVHNPSCLPNPPVLLQAWQRICDASRREFQKIYDRLDVTLEGGFNLHSAISHAFLTCRASAALAPASMPCRATLVLGCSQQRLGALALQGAQP